MALCLVVSLVSLYAQDVYLAYPSPSLCLYASITFSVRLIWTILLITANCLLISSLISFTCHFFPEHFQLFNILYNLLYLFFIVCHHHPPWKFPEIRYLYLFIYWYISKGLAHNRSSINICLIIGYKWAKKCPKSGSFDLVWVETGREKCMKTFWYLNHIRATYSEALRWCYGLNCVMPSLQIYVSEP